MGSELLSVEVTHEGVLPQYSVQFLPPPQWLGMITAIQQEYLQHHEKSSYTSFADTIRDLQTIVISKRLASTDEQTLLDLLTFHSMNLGELFLILHDPKVTEVFCNKLGNEIMISHLDYGRCRTNLTFSKEFWRALKIRVELDSGRPLNASQPALKIGISSHLGNLRISLQIEPLSTLGPTFSIRRLPSKAISLEKLVSDEQIEKRAASFLENAIRDRMNIVIAGEPGSGKTTLANALLEKTNRAWRLIIMEDAKEISIDPMQFPMLVQYSMPAVGTSNRYSQRSNEISRLLHRSPDYVFLGEIQNQDDTKVTFEGFAAGIRGMATTHARNFSGLLTRWTQSHELSEELLSSIDIVVITCKELEGGKVKLTTSEIMQRKNGGFKSVFQD